MRLRDRTASALSSGFCERPLEAWTRELGNVHLEREGVEISAHLSFRIPPVVDIYLIITPSSCTRWGLKWSCLVTRWVGTVLALGSLLATRRTHEWEVEDIFWGEMRISQPEGKWATSCLFNHDREEVIIRLMGDQWRVSVSLHDRQWFLLASCDITSHLEPPASWFSNGLSCLATFEGWRVMLLHLMISRIHLFFEFHCARLPKFHSFRKRNWSYYPCNFGLRRPRLPPSYQ